MTGIRNKANLKGKPSLNILFIYYMPFRGIAKLMGGAIDMAMADAILTIFNGHFFKGLGYLVRAWIRKSQATKDTARKLAEAASKND